VVRFELSTLDSEPGLVAYMNIFARTNEVAAKYNLKIPLALALTLTLTLTLTFTLTLTLTLTLTRWSPSTTSKRSSRTGTPPRKWSSLQRHEPGAWGWSPPRAWGEPPRLPAQGQIAASG
jgi:hypothetical protein